LPTPTKSEVAFEALLARFDDEPDGVQTPVQAAQIGRRERVKAAGDVLAPDAEPNADAGAFLEALFAKSSEYLERDRFGSIGEADDFFTKIMGVSFEGRQDLVAGLTAGEPLELVREPENPHDASAIQVRYGALQLGFLRREIAKRLAPNFDAGERYTAEVASVTGGGNKNVGVNIFVRRERPRTPPRAVVPAGTALPGLAAGSDEIRRALIGERHIREPQRAVLDRLAAGRNTLAVMGTGRGKSFCFQLPAAERALGSGEKTLVFYPLRALANDQYEALRQLGYHPGDA
jgi:single-stranded-DNA-specific exonuclease